MKTALVIVVILVGLCSMSATDDDQQTTKFKVTTRRTDDTVEVQAEKGRTVFVIKSPFGISQAVIERQDEKSLSLPDRFFREEQS